MAVVGATSPLTPATHFYTNFGPPELTNVAGGGVVYWSSTDTEQGFFACGGGDGNCVTGTGNDWTLIRTGDVVHGREICELDSAPRVSDYGVAFRARTLANCANAAEALQETVMRLDFAETVGPEVIALVGAASDLGPTVPYARFSDTPTINDNGVLAFRGDVTGGGTISEAVFRCNPAAGCPGGTAVGRTLYVRRTGGAIQVVATGNQVVDDEPTATLRRVGIHHGNSDGTIVFRSTVTGPPWKVGLFLWQP